MGLLVVFGGLWAAQKIPWSDNEITNTALTGAASTAAVLMGLGRAGVGDMTTLMLATGAGLGSVAGEISGLAGGSVGGTPLWQYGIPGLREFRVGQQLYRAIT
jgi:hypothetical protein